MMRYLVVFLMLGIPAVCQSAALRGVTTLHGPHVYLRDLFDDAGDNAGRVLGPGPGPGGRIVVGAAQLGAIARQFGVDWRPVSSGDRAMLEWPGRPLRREDALDAVRSSLIAAGASLDCLIELTGFNAPIVPLEAAPMPIVTQLDYDAANGRFTAVLSVMGEGMDPVNTRISGRADDTVELPVATARLAAGSVTRAEDVHVVRVSTSLARGEVARLPSQVIGLQLRRQIVAGQPFAMGDLSRPNAVMRGALVRMELESAGLALEGQGTALDAGAAGERIRVQNMSSRAIIEAEVIGPGRVRVRPSAGGVLVTVR